MKFNRKTLSISTAYPTVVGVPKAEGEAELEKVTTRTSVGWPDNWHLLPPKVKAVLLANVVHKVLGSFLGAGSPRQDTAVYTEFCRLTGWGSPATKKKTRKSRC